MTTGAALSTGSPRQTANLAGGLVAETCGPHILIRQRHEPARDRHLLATVPDLSGALLVLASSGAYREPSLVRAAVSMLRPLLAPDPSGRPCRYRTVWLGIANAATWGTPDTALLGQLSKELGIEVVAPDGGLISLPGCGLYVGPTIGANGWRMFGDHGSNLVSTRYPIPPWESAMPRQRLAVAGLVAEPVPAGLAVRQAQSAPTTPDELAFRVTTTRAWPQVIVGRQGEPPIHPGAMAMLLSALGGVSPVLVPAIAAVANASWLGELVQRLGQQVVVSGGLHVYSNTGPRSTVVLDGRGAKLFSPFGTLFRQVPGGVQEVINVAPAPPGWEQCGQRLYRVAGGGSLASIVAEVVPGGLVLRPAAAIPTGRPEPFDPLGWTISLGVSGVAIDETQLAALERLLGSLGHGQRRSLRLRVCGDLGKAERTRLARLADSAEVVVDPSRPAQSPVPTSVPSTRGWATPPVTPAVPTPGPAPRPALDEATPTSTVERISASTPDVTSPGTPGPANVVPDGASPPSVPRQQLRIPRPSQARSSQARSSQSRSSPAKSSPELPSPRRSPLRVPAPLRVPSVRPPAEPPSPPPPAPASSTDDAPPTGVSGTERPAAASPGSARPVLRVPSAPPAATPPAFTPPAPPAAAPDSSAAAPYAAPDSSAGGADAVPHEPGPSAPSPQEPRSDAGSAVLAVPPASPPVPPPAVPGPPPGMAPIVTVSSAPVSTVSGPTAPASPPKFPGAESPDGESPDAESPAPPRTADPAHAAGDQAGQLDLGQPDQPTPESATSQPPEPARKPFAGPAIPVIIPDRPSTPAEQGRFAAAAGEAFTDALATVNAALATWPALRHSDAGVKTDYVAVCLYLGRGHGGAARLNEALHTGSGVPFDGYLPCLVSGIRRLPTHRRALLRQCVLGEPVEQRYPVGSVLAAPDFLSASVGLDVAVPGADLDMLIWPRSARRTSELGLSRPIDEALFLAGRRFKALAVRIADADPEGEEQDGPRAPRTAVLVRELSPDEKPGTSEVDSRDRAALAKLERAWAQRQRVPVRTLDDPDIVVRLTAPLVDTGAVHAGVAAMVTVAGASGAPTTAVTS